MRSERAEFLDLILRATQDGIVDWDLVTNQETYNPRWTHLFGFDAEDLKDQPIEWRTLVHPDDAEEAERVVTDHLEHDWPFVTTLRMRHRHSGYRTMLCRGAAQRDEARRAVRMVIIFSDISDRIELEDRQRALASALPDTIFRVSIARIVLELKRGDDHEFSPFRQLELGSALGQCLPERVTRQLESAFSIRAKGGATVRSIELTTPHGPAAALHHEIRLVESGQDDWVCIVRDVTAQHALADRLTQSQKLGAIGQLAAGVAHEINTPMQYIGDNLHFAQTAIEDLLGFGDHLKGLVCSCGHGEGEGEGDALLPERVARAENDADIPYIRAELPRAIERSLEGVARMTTIVRALKTFAHPSGREFSPVDLKSLIEATVAVATNEWKYVAEVELDCESALPLVNCAGGELSQVVLNLVVNAAHAIGDAVSGTATKGRIKISARQVGENVELRVEDSGTGIPEHARAKVFEPFFTTKDVGKGTGQGLALAHACIVNHHRGSIHFETALGRGTTFFVTIPIAGRSPDENDATVA